MINSAVSSGQRRNGLLHRRLLRRSDVLDELPTESPSGLSVVQRIPDA